MIRLTKITKHDFLGENTIKKMQEVGVPMDDATYRLLLIDGTWYICPTDDVTIIKHKYTPEQDLPTYTLPQLLFKLSEWHELYKGLQLGGPIIWKDAPFYFAQFKDAEDNGPYSFYRETPIEAAAQLLISCVKEGHGCVRDIRGKYE